MDIQKVNINYFLIDSLNDNSENLRQIKVLPWLSVVQAVEGSYDIQIGTQKQKTRGMADSLLPPPVCNKPLPITLIRVLAL